MEAIEDPARAYMLGVLWHPEEDEADRLIAAFVHACRDRRAGGSALGAAGTAGLTVKRGDTNRTEQRRNASVRRRAAVPLPCAKVTRATILWRPRP